MPKNARKWRYRLQRLTSNSRGGSDSDATQPPRRGVQRKEAIQRLAEGAVQADLARSYGVSQATISRLAAPSPFAEGAAVA